MAVAGVLRSSRGRGPLSALFSVSPPPLHSEPSWRCFNLPFACQGDRPRSPGVAPGEERVDKSGRTPPALNAGLWLALWLGRLCGAPGDQGPQPTPRKRGLGEAVATSPGCPGRLRCPEQGLGSAPGWVGRPPVGARAWCSRAQHCTQGRACVQPLLTSSLVPGDAGGGVPVSPSFCPGRTSQKSSCECPRGLAWLGRCPQDPQCLDPPAACESTGPFP